MRALEKQGLISRKNDNPIKIKNTYFYTKRIITCKTEKPEIAPEIAKIILNNKKHTKETARQIFDLTKNKPFNINIIKNAHQACFKTSPPPEKTEQLQEFILNPSKTYPALPFKPLNIQNLLLNGYKKSEINMMVETNKYVHEQNNKNLISACNKIGINNYWELTREDQQDINLKIENNTFNQQDCLKYKNKKVSDKEQTYENLMKVINNKEKMPISNKAPEKEELPDWLIKLNKKEEERQKENERLKEVVKQCEIWDAEEKTEREKMQLEKRIKLYKEKTGLTYNGIEACLIELGI